MEKRDIFTKIIAVVGTILVGSQALAILTGLASGENRSAGWMALILAAIAVYALAVLATGVGGLLLLRDLNRTSRLSKESFLASEGNK